jgi:quinoprotein glucose dehydrogenase
MEERPVPQSTVPGEATSPTQPFPLKPPPLARNSFSKEDMYSLTPEQAAFCKDLWERNHMFTEGPFTPMPVIGNALTYPSTIGGGNWSGLSVDPTLGYVFTNIMNLAQWGHMEKREDPGTGQVSYWRNSEMGPYGRFWNPKTHIPCQKPPFGELVAVNINTGDVAWRVPLGTVEELEAKGVKNTGAVNLGGSIATAGGLIFIGATNDRSFRAFDSKTGKQLWVAKIDADGHSVPITYLGTNGKQYVAIMAGGNGYFGDPPNDSLIAFTLSHGPLRQDVQRAQTASHTAVAALRTAPHAKLGNSNLPDGQGKAIVQRMCGTCHPIDLVTSERHDRAGWSTLVQTMVARGATGTKEQIQQVIDYLTTHFGS